MTGKSSSLAVLAVCQVAAMALWFSASAVVPALREAYALDGFAQSLFTSSVQAGFVAGALASAVTGLADRLDPRRFFMVSALIGATANAAILLVEPTSIWVAVLRFVTGVTMAGIYPGGMKVATTWAKGDMGFLLGLLVGALTLGSATPHLFNALGGVDWRITIATASVSAFLAAMLINLAGLGPNHRAAPRFEPRMVLRAWQVKSVRLANLGYFGHMWELYAMWAWVGLFLHASFAATMAPAAAATAAKLATFATVGVGAVGCLVGGLAADRIGRTATTMLAMAVSGGCAATVGLLFGADPWLVTALCLVWGVAIVADSAQFSAAIAELSDRGLVGTMLTTQTCIGFLLTLVTIHLMPSAIAFLGWRYAFAPLAIGPVLGIVAMARLRAHPDAAKIASGNR